MSLRKLKLLLLILIISCSENGRYEWKTDNSSLIMEKYVNDKLIQSTQFNLDSIKEGEEFIYYPNGRIKRLNTYSNGELYGQQIEYYNLPYDTFLTLKNIGDTILAWNPYPSRYYFVNSNKDIAFELDFSKSNKVESKFGSSLIEYFSPDTIALGEDYGIQLLLANPQNLNSVLSFKISLEDSVVLDEKLKFDRTLWEYKFTPDKDGTYIVKLQYILKGIAKTIDLDSLEFSFIVKPQGDS